MIASSHQRRPIYELIRGTVRSIPAFDSLLMHWVRSRRVREASALMTSANLFPDSREQITADYAYSIARSHRGVMQVINLECVLRQAEAFGIEGCFVETGTYTGGASAYALLALQRLRSHKPPRAYWGFDSFEGMPTPSREDGDHGSMWVEGKRLNDINQSRLGAMEGHSVNKADYDQCLTYLKNTGYPSENLHLVKGWFQDTLKVHKAQLGPIAVLRLDGDFYESTKIVFEELFDQVVEGGFIIIDDYGSFEGCRRATDEFLAARGIKANLIYVEHAIRYFIKNVP